MRICVWLGRLYGLVGDDVRFEEEGAGMIGKDGGLAGEDVKLVGEDFGWWRDGRLLGRMLGWLGSMSGWLRRMLVWLRRKLSLLVHRNHISAFLGKRAKQVLACSRRPALCRC